ncbi:PH domain-containing protein [Streptomyces goshikiensis]|uniref:PH domain-containing protein n=1 Tax=Streptomyces goshikiensis TaxID=1942 RepID=UPI0036BA412C
MSPVQPGPLLAPASVTFTALPRAALSVWRWKLTITAIPAALVVAGVFGLLVPLARPSVPSWPGLGLAGVLLAGAAFRWWRLKAAWAISGYSLTGDELLSRGGLFLRYLSALPYGRIQTVEVGSGPLQRRFGLATVKVATGTFHRLVVHDVPIAEAEEIRDALTRLATERQVSL